MISDAINDVYMKTNEIWRIFGYDYIMTHQP